MKRIKLITLFCMVYALNTMRAEVLITPEWTRILQANTMGTSNVNAITIDTGNVYTACKVTGKIVFESNSYTSVGLNDLLLVKINNNGEKQWVKQINAQANGYITPNTIKVDGNGNVYVAATFLGTVNIGSSTVSAGVTVNSFYAKFDSAGNGVWATAFLATGNGSSEIAIDEAGNSFLISKTSKLIKFNSLGVLAWEQSFFDRTLQAIEVSGSNVYLGGMLQKGTTNFGTISLVSLGGWNTGFLVKANTDGVYSASTVLGGSVLPSGDGSSVSDIIIDNAGNLMITGAYTKDLMLTGTTPIVNSTAGYYSYIAKCDNNFSFEWSKSSSVFLNPNRDMNLYRIYTDKTNSIYQIGMIKNDFSFGLVAANPLKLARYLVKFDALGNALYGLSLPNDFNDKTIMSKNATIIAGGSVINPVHGSLTGDFRIAQYNINTISKSIDVSWQKSSSESIYGTATINYIKHDAAGNSYIQARVVGYCNYFGTMINSEIAQTIISKHDNTGKMLWLKRITDYSPALFGAAFTLDKDNNVLTIGLFYNTINIDNTVLNSTNTILEGYVAKYSSKGEFLWAKKLDLNTNLSERITLASDNSGNVLVSGVLAPSNFIVKFDGTGNKLWQKILPMESYYLSLISTDANNNIYLTSEIHLSDGSGTTILDQVTLSQAKTDGATALIKLSPEGTVLWGKTYGGEASLGYSDGWPCDFKTDAAGNSYLWGWSVNNAAFGSFTLKNPILTNAGYSYFISKIDSNGTVVWAKAIHETKIGFNYGNLLDLDQNGNVYVGGHFNAKINIDGAEYLPEGTNDFFVAKYSNSGVYQWLKTIPANSNIINSISVSYENVLGVAGYVGSNGSLANTNFIFKGGSSCMVATLGNLPLMTISVDSISIAASANNSNSFNITSDTKWTASSDQNWLLLNTSSGTGNANVSLTALANPLSANRQANVTVFINAVASKTIKVIQMANSTGIYSITDNDMMFYPNPAKNYLNLSHKIEGGSVTIFDYSGKMVLNNAIKNNNIDISNLSNGIFTIMITHKTGVMIRIFMKQ